jgi:Right handed beta helix region
MTESRMSENERCGLIAWQGARVRTLRCEMDASRCDLESHGACAKGAGTHLLLTDCDMHDVAGSGVAAERGAAVEMRNCVATDCGQWGVEAAGAGTRVTVDGLQLHRNARGGHTAHSGAKVRRADEAAQPTMLRRLIRPKLRSALGRGSTSHSAELPAVRSESAPSEPDGAPCTSDDRREARLQLEDGSIRNGHVKKILCALLRPLQL